MNKINFYKELTELFKKGLNPESFNVAWKQYNAHFCDYVPAYSQKCGHDKSESSLAHVAVIYGDKTYWLCDKHSNKKCFKCGRPATEECHFAGQFLCGIEHCPEHTHGH